MKEEIYTIPVMDGFKSDCACPFCAMKATAEEKAIGFVLSPAYMEEDVRGKTNEAGFCPSHLQTLYSRRNTLGLALMLQSRLQVQRAALSGVCESGKGKKRPADGDKAAAAMRAKLGACYLCDTVNAQMGHFFTAFFSLWKKEKDFPSLVFEKHYCLEHFLTLYETASSQLSGSALNDFRERLYAAEKEALDTMQEDLDWFITKFDYRFRDEPWKNSKDAVPRAAEMLKGIKLE